MPTSKNILLSIVVPVYNERAGITGFNVSLKAVLSSLSGIDYEIIYCNDGSTDGSMEVLQALAERDTTIRILCFTRNFGKEVATTAGIHAAHGDAIMTLDADGQHPVERIPEFVAKWQKGVKVVIGLRTGREASFTKRFGSKLFYGLFRRVSGIKMEPGSSDFRLIDRSVQQEFAQMTERNRITRGLIDWLGYEREYVSYKENARMAGTSPYSFRKLVKLAIDSAISLSLSPLYITAYIGAVVLPLATLLGVGMIINFLLQDPLHLHAQGGAYVMVLVLFLIGILLVSQGIIGLYLSHIHTETQNRPLYVVDSERSVRLV
jgi:glycosyltransferase involved in cell wall biosynthesis